MIWNTWSSQWQPKYAYLSSILIITLLLFKLFSSIVLHNNFLLLSGFTANVDFYNNSTVKVTCQNPTFVNSSSPMMIQAYKGNQYGSCLPQTCLAGPCKSLIVLFVCILMKTLQWNRIIWCKKKLTEEHKKCYIDRLRVVMTQ